MTLTLKFTDEAWRRLRSALAVRKMAAESWGIPEQVVAKMIDRAEAGEDVITFRTKEDGDEP